MSHLTPLQFLPAGTSFSLPSGGDVTEGILIECPPEADAKVSLNGKVQYWAATTLVYPGRTGATQPQSPKIQEHTTMATKTTTATPKATKGAAAKPAVNGKAVSNGEHTPRAKKEGLRAPQVRVLAYLAKTKSATRAEIAAGAPADLAMLNSYIGSIDEARRATNDAKNFPCLLTLNAVKYARVSEEEGVKYEITAAGRQLLAKALKAAK